MALDEKRWQKKLARKRKAQSGGKAKREPLRANMPLQAAQFPIGHCLAPRDLFEKGIGMVVLCRTLPDGDLAVAGFLMDVFCLGVKNAFYRLMPPQQVAQIVGQFGLEPIDPTALRKLVEGAVEYARALGFPPHPDYAKAAKLFGGIDGNACAASYAFGKDGKPFYVSGPNESPAQSRRILAALERRLGPGGFEFLVAVDASRDQMPDPGGKLDHKRADERLP